MVGNCRASLLDFGGIRHACKSSTGRGGLRYLHVRRRRLRIKSPQDDHDAAPASIDATLALLAKADYIADRSLATVLYLSLRMGRPLFLEGEAGVGKTEIAKVLSKALGRRLIRLQCYEGLDVSAAVYEWNYGAQMIAIRLAEAEGEGDRARIEHDVFSEHFLIKRPLLQALEPDPDGPPVLLIDEIDRTDEAFEAFLLEVLADFQVTVPELGTIKAAASADRGDHLQPHARSARRA